MPVKTSDSISKVEQSIPVLGVNLELSWIKTNLRTCEKRLYDSLFVEGVPDGQVFSVLEGALKQFNDYVYSEDAPMAKISTRRQNTCCFSSLASAFCALGDERAEMAIASRIVDSLSFVPFRYKNRIDFAIDVLLAKKRVRKPNEPRLGLTIQEFKHVGQVNVLEYSYNGATIVQLEDILGNTSHCITIAGKWIFDSNFERGLPVSIESLHMCCTDPEDTTGH